MRKSTILLLCISVASGCGDAVEDVASGALTGASPGPGLSDAGVALAPVSRPDAAVIVATTASVQDAAAANGANTSAAAATNGLPCEVQRILKDKCQTCHSDPVTGGAAMPLLTREHFLQSSTIVAGEKIAARVQARINDAQKPMPPLGRPSLTAPEKTTLEQYIAKKTPISAETCAAGAGDEKGANADDFGVWQPDWSECDATMELIAHGAQTLNDPTPYAPPGGTDHYEMFWYTPTWSEKVHAIRIDPIVDNKAVLHHWLLYMKDEGSEPDGSHNGDTGLQGPDTQLLSGWAPGNKSIPFGRDIGMQVIQGSKARFGMEIHYNTLANPQNRNDRSGARICVTKKLRPKEAATHWLGTQLIFNPLPSGGMLDTPSTCTVQKESHIIAHSPHMHLQGRHMKSIVTRKNGEEATITDKPFAFDDQQVYPVDAPNHEIVVQPGDVIDTTCTYDASRAFTFGPYTMDEMCYNFVVAWPVGSLSNGSAGPVGGKNTCIDLF